MVSFEIFVKAMPPSLSELKVLPSFCFAFKIPDDVLVTIIYGSWASTKNPLNIIGDFNDVLANSLHMYVVPIEVTKWAYMNGNGNFSQCLEEQETFSKSCKSIFHPKSFKCESRSVFQKSTYFLIF